MRANLEVDVRQIWPGAKEGREIGRNPGRAAIRAFCALFAPALLMGAVLATVAAVIAAPVASTKKEDGFSTSVPAAILLDADSDSILFDKNGDQLVAPRNSIRTLPKPARRSRVDNPS